MGSIVAAYEVQLAAYGVYHTNVGDLK